MNKQSTKCPGQIVIFFFPSSSSFSSISAAEELSCLGMIQKKMTVNATDDSYDKARQSMAQAEEETRSRGAIVIKHGGRYQGTVEKKKNPKTKICRRGYTGGRLSVC